MPLEVEPDTTRQDELEAMSLALGDIASRYLVQCSVFHSGRATIAELFTSEMRHRDRVVCANAILEQVWGAGFDSAAHRFHKESAGAAIEREMAGGA